MTMLLLLLLLVAGSSVFEASAFAIVTHRQVHPRHAAAPAATASSFPSPTRLATTALASTPAAASDAETEPGPIPTSDVVQRVAVAGATGRTGSLVVKELLRRGVGVVALVRDEKKAEEVLLPAASDPSSDEAAELTVVKCNLGDEGEIKSAVENCDAAIWCATGFSDAPSQTIIDKLKSMFGAAVAPQRSIDAVGIPALADAFLAQSGGSNGESGGNCPRVIMLSSAGATRPSWTSTKKAKFEGSADIPIVRLNPFGILDIKAESERKLRSSGVGYAIFRPGGLNDEWPAGSRPIFSQGDLAVGRINRLDVATILVDCLSTPEATGKTFEGVSVAGYPPAMSIRRALSRLRPDGMMGTEGTPSMEALEATYAVMQQLLPGEVQAPERLAMGQTYEQLDRGETGRLGVRGTEDAEAQMTPTTSD